MPNTAANVEMKWGSIAENVVVTILMESFAFLAEPKNEPVNWDETSTAPSDYSRENVYEDESGTYTADRLVLLSGNYDTKKIEIRQGTRIICNGALGSYLTAEDEYKKAIVEELIIPDSVTQIGRSAFGGCSSLQSIVIPDSVTHIARWAFSDCRSLQSIVIPNSVTRIEGSVFYGCSSLQSIIIPKGSKAKFQELLPQYRDLLIER